ncbi:hypothetical protein HHI36_014940 [Cryptolaemus montrouzieri]|uniref:HMG box domain-containing protein n=1 Tax=Cryptolaemus montrouzieri TaxID=559131 RepID=A0ABD2N5D8_9CUCU
MISRSIFSKSFLLGKCAFPNNFNVRFLIPKINVTCLYNAFSDQKSQEVIQLPEKPKKPVPPFLRYFQEHRIHVLQEHPDWKATEVARKCSEDWKNIHSTIKQRYENEYKEARAVYAKEYLDYSMKLTEEQRVYIKELSQEKKEISKKRRTRQKLKELKKPKKPPSPYFMYLMDQAQIQNKKLNELMSELGSQWENLPPSEKLHYANRRTEAWAQYNKELEDWETKMLQEGHSEFVRVKTLKEKRPMSSKKNTKNAIQGEKKRKSKTGTSPNTETEKQKKAKGTTEKEENISRADKIKDE